VEFEFPAAGVAGDAPELEHSGFGDYGFEGDGDDFGGAFAGAEADFHGREFMEFVAVILDEVADLIVLAGGGGEEAELGGLADDEAQFTPRDPNVRAFFPAAA